MALIDVRLHEPETILHNGFIRRSFKSISESIEPSKRLDIRIIRMASDSSNSNRSFRKLSINKCIDLRLSSPLKLPLPEKLLDNQQRLHERPWRLLFLGFNFLLLGKFSIKNFVGKLRVKKLGNVSNVVKLGFHFVSLSFFVK